MSFLAPFYILGVLAVSLPVLFHLLRRSPRGRVHFSSLMFLSASPPRITRRSRVDNWLLLFLRATVLCLLALAFARPFLRDAAPVDLERSRGKRIAILVDTSASMRRGDLWSQAVAKANAVLDDAKLADEIALFTFDDRVRKLVGFGDDVEVPAGQRPALLKSRLASARPTWGATDLGGALMAVADLLDVSPPAAPAEQAAPPDRAAPLDRALQIILITDLQRGSRLEALAAYDWPERVRLTVERVSPPETSNAGLVLLTGGDASVSDATRPHRVRILNEADSRHNQFSLGWASATEDEPAAQVTSVYVPPGESRVASAARPAREPQADRLVLTGDDHDFDNTVHVAPPPREEVTVLYVGPEAADDAGDLRYYAERALAEGGRRQVRFVSHPPDRPLEPDAKHPPRLVVVTADVGEALEKGLLRAMQSGSTVLYVVKDAASTRSLAALLECEALSAEEVDSGEYAMLSDIDFSHPIFASFADPRFSDFTKIRFWRRRRLTLGGEKSAVVRVLARFDDGDPALLERAKGKGRILVLTSGWQPLDSQLALSTKFVPLLASILESHPAEDTVSFHVYDPIPVPPPVQDTPRRVRKPDGTEIVLAAGDVCFGDTDQPGIYELEVDAVQRRVAVNLSPSESKTAPLEVVDLEHHGVQLGVQKEDVNRQRQMRALELESSQRLWKWLVAAAVGLLILETWLAGRLARSASAKEVKV